MKSKYVRPLLALVLLVALAPILASAPQTPLGPQTTPEEIKTYEAFRAWIGQQPADVQQGDDAVVFKRYSEELLRQGRSATEIAATIESLRAIGDRAEIERWNRILTAPAPAFNTEPNAFLVTMTKGLKPGRSLAVGMGQGRNTIFTGFRVVRYEEPTATSDFGRFETKVVRLAAVK